jgi:hypothetical protein
VFISVCLIAGRQSKKKPAIFLNDDVQAAIYCNARYVFRKYNAKLRATLLGVGHTQGCQICVGHRLGLLLQNAADWDIKFKYGKKWQLAICPVLRICFLDVRNESFAGGKQIIRPGDHVLSQNPLVDVGNDPFVGGDEKNHF